MKYEVFASQLEAQVGQSPVRGGEAIKTDRTDYNFHPISAYAQRSIKAFFYDFRKYMEENYNATPEQLMLDWNNVGATARFIGNGCNIQYRLWERSNGYLGIPDMTLIVHVFSVTDTMENAVALCRWTAEAARSNGFCHIADPDRQPEDADNQIPDCKIACLTL